MSQKKKKMVPITVRYDKEFIDKIRAWADETHIPYQVLLRLLLIKQFEQLEGDVKNLLR